MKQELIDNYILGKMSAEERQTFELEISQDSEMQKEVALHRDIVRAIRMKAAKEHLRNIENEIQATEQRKKTFKILSPITTMAACLVSGVCIASGAFFYVDTALDYRNYGLNIIQEEIIATKVSDRGVESLSDKTIDAIKNNDFNKALSIIEEGEKLEDTFSDPNPTLEEQAHQEYKIEQEDLQWYKAVVYMCQGRWIKAKKLLKKIAASDSFYKADAQKALNEL